ncbi:MAG: 6-phospho-beta-glucosidase [Clostridiales bacterium]|nr:6-phospho-beta-glucosidase [Clostridiales bacterium]
MKISVIGGGGVRSMFLAKSIAQKAKRLSIDELCFMDNNKEKLRIYGGMAAHVAKKLCPDLKFVLTDNAVEAVTNADYVITTIRVGEDDMRAKDERIALNKGILGQETTGASGFSFAMRSVPALAEYCELIKKYSSKNVKVFNFTNPAGVVSQTLRDMGYDFTYGICDAPSGMLRSFALLYNESPDNISGEVYGLNHLSYFKSITLNGKEIMPQLIENDEAYKKTDMRYFDKELLRDRKCILNEYLYYFYYREQAVENILKADKTRGEQIRDINKNMTAELSKMDIQNDFEGCLKVFNKWYGMRESSYMASETGVKRTNLWEFDIFEEDDGGYAGVALKFIEMALTDSKGSMIMCVPNNGSINGLRDDDVVEITCDVSSSGCTPHKIGDVDEQNLELIRRVKIYERLASKAIRNKDRSSAVQALTLHPLVNSYSLASELVDEFIEHNKQYSDGWK